MKRALNYLERTLYPEVVNPAFRFAKTHFIRKKKDLSNSVSPVCELMQAGDAEGANWL